MKILKKMDKKNKLKKILDVLTTSDNLADDSFNEFEQSVKKLQTDLKTNITVKTIDEVNSKLSSFTEQKQKDIEEVLSALASLKEDVANRKTDLESLLNTKYSELDQAQKTTDKAGKTSQTAINSILSVIEILKDNIAELSKPKEDKLPSVIQSIKDLEDKINKTIEAQGKDISQNTLSITESKKTGDNSKTELLNEINTLREEVFRRLSNVGGGGNANRQMFIGGADPLKRYTDMNLKAGQNVTINYANNDKTKQVDVTFIATGTGSGITRSINSVSISTVAAATAGTDYVYLCTGTIDLTLPDATTNTNLYTIKNVGTGVVTIKTTSAQTVDGQTTLVMPVQFTSVDLISDTANWNLT